MWLLQKWNWRFFFFLIILFTRVFFFSPIGFVGLGLFLTMQQKIQQTTRDDR